MGRIRSLVAICFVLLLVMTQYNNCDTYSAAALQAEYNLDSTPSLSGSSVLDEATYIELEINNVDPIVLIGEGGEYPEFDVAGDCYPGDFSNNYIEWRVKDSSGETVSHSTRNECVGGRFQLPISAKTFVPGIQYTVEVELVSVSNSGQEFRNSLLAKKSIRVYGSTQ